MSEFLVTIGTFDGVHLGHRMLARWAIAQAKKRGLKSRAVFFVQPPRFYFRPELTEPLLTTGPERKAILKTLGFDAVEILRFGKRWATMPHTKFFEDLIVKRWRAKGVLVGKDFAFGKGRLGDLAFLRGACKAREMSLGILPLLRVAGRKISSSDIRALLLNGDARRAARLLGRPHALSGRVIRGRGLGRKLGFPTANVRVNAESLTPPGVFEVRVSGPGFRFRRALCNVGLRPTVSRAKRARVEVHIPGFSGNLYGKRLKVEFLRRIRREMKFKSVSALVTQITKDLAILK